ncbi:MAG TPA: hypothetical protein VHC91_09515 [Trinickia sp.]|uniref:hypothetical protein n=1 Tax=Trinickia sp. TaxID=2571163 RepID=UPI002B6131DC|nr:hypothetical protein [Trinickia sp.]HVW50621.1 hypothetical protein [Trinickia sp.]
MLKARLSEVAARLSVRPAQAQQGRARPDASPADMQGRLTGRLRALLGRPAGSHESQGAAGASPAIQCVAPQPAAPARSAVGPTFGESYSERAVLDPDFRGVLYVAHANGSSDHFASLIRVTDSSSGRGTPRIEVGPAIDSWRGREPMTPFARQVMQDELREQMRDGRCVRLNETFPDFRFLQRVARQSSE